MDDERNQTQTGTSAGDIDFDMGVRDVDDARMDVPGLVTEQEPVVVDDGLVVDDVEGDELGVEKFGFNPEPLTAYEGDEMGVERFGAGSR